MELDLDMENDAGKVRVIYNGGSQMTIITSSYIGEAHGYCVYHPVCTCSGQNTEEEGGTPSEKCVQENHNTCRLCEPASIYSGSNDRCVGGFAEQRWISCQPAYN